MKKTLNEWEELTRETIDSTNLFKTQMSDLKYTLLSEILDCTVNILKQKLTDCGRIAWITKTATQFTINFGYEINDTIIYNDIRGMLGINILLCLMRRRNDIESILKKDGDNIFLDRTTYIELMGLFFSLYIIPDKSTLIIKGIYDE